MKMKLNKKDWMLMNEKLKHNEFNEKGMKNKKKWWKRNEERMKKE